MGRRRLLAALALIAAVSAMFASPATTFGEASTFCDRTIVAKVPWYSFFEPARDGRLGFGPPSIRMKVLPRLVATGGKVGYELFLQAGAKPAHPRWRVRTSLARFYPRQSLHVFREGTDRQVRTIGSSAKKRFLFEVPDEPAYYFISAHFASLDDRRTLYYFRLYFRVIRPTDSARLVLDSNSYRSGQTVLGRIENHGTDLVSFGAPYRIERHDGMAWSLAPESPHDFILPLYSAYPGESGVDCSLFPIPPSMASGHYRMTKEVGFGRPLRAGKTTTLIAEFDVVP